MKPYTAKEITVKFVRFTRGNLFPYLLFSWNVRRCELKIIPQFPLSLYNQKPQFPVTFEKLLWRGSFNYSSFAK